MDWRALRVAREGTHHLAGGAPAYEERFDEVLKFHEPGLAPVRRGGRAWHVQADGTSAYGRRFVQAFGYYEGRAAVADEEGWRHILPDGSELSEQRHAWCGNFQGGRSVARDADGRYLHLREDGTAAYPARWAYAGDFRDGAAVVKRDDGQATHVDIDGSFVHGRWFQDLDVFHKGHARARDAEGWFHVDSRGEPVHPARFAAVEAFYNGQAFVERHDGSQCVIGHNGAPIVELVPPWSKGRLTAPRGVGRRLLLIGLGAAGKTSAGRRLAGRWGVPFVSLDDCRRRWGDGTVGGDHLARAMFLRACGALDAGVFETSGAGPYRHATRAALAERDAPLVVCWLDVAQAIRRARRGRPPSEIPFPIHAQGAWTEAEGEATLLGDLRDGAWSPHARWRAYQVDASGPLDEVVSLIEALVAEEGVR